MLRRQGFANILQHLLSVNQHEKNEEVWLQAIKLNQAHIFSNQLEKNTQLAQLLSIEPAELLNRKVALVVTWNMPTFTTSRSCHHSSCCIFISSQQEDWARHAESKKRQRDTKRGKKKIGKDLEKEWGLKRIEKDWKGLKRIEKDWKGLKRIEKDWKGLKRIEKDWKGLKRIEKDWKGLKRIEKDWKGLKRIEKDWKGTKFFQSSLSSRFILERLGDGFLDLLVGWLVFEERLYHGCRISSQQGLENLKFLQKVHWTRTSTLQARLYSLRAILYPHLIKLKCFNQRRCFRRLEPCWYHQTFKRVDLVQRLQANVVSIQSCRNEAIWVNNKIKMCEIVCWPHLNGENWVLNRVPEDAFGIGKGLDPCFHWSQSFHGWNIPLNRDLCQVPQGILHNKPCQNEKTSQFAVSIQIYILLTHVKPSFLHTVELTEHNSLQWS